MARIRWSAVLGLVLAAALAGGSGAAREPGNAPKDGKHKQVPGELIVKFRPGVTPSKKGRGARRGGAEGEERSSRPTAAWSSPPVTRPPPRSR